MIESIIRFSVRNKAIIALGVLLWIAAGVYNLQRLPIDAVPDITNNQVQVVTTSPSLAAQEVEQLISYPVEVAMSNIPNITEIRSISRYGLSVVTIVFEDQVPVLEARQYVKEQIDLAADEIPAGLGSPELMPITTGLGEIYQYVLIVEPEYESLYDIMSLRTIQDWIVKRRLAGIRGIIEISSFGGKLKQYEVALDPGRLLEKEITVAEVFDALERNNQNSGGSYIERNTNAYYIRTEGWVQSTEEIAEIAVTERDGVPILIRDLGEVRFGSPQRYGAMTMDGKGEAVGGITLMLKGDNASATIKRVHERIAEIQTILPEGVRIHPYLDRSDLVGEAIHTVQKNLLEGGLIVIFVLILLLGNWRAGLIVASVIPLAMLFAVVLMNYFGVTANLMSLGAIDFGIVVDGAVIIVEGVLHALVAYHVGKTLTREQMDETVISASTQLFRPAVFGVLIILVVFLPILSLTGIEGRMFRPMAQTFSFAIIGALLLSLTYVPAISAWVLPRKISDKETLSDRFLRQLKRIYRPAVRTALRLPGAVLAGAGVLLVIAFLVFRSLGSVFIPTLEEGDLAMQMTVQPGSSLSESIQTSTKAERILLDNFPEVEHVVSKIGTAEVPTDPMAIEDADIMIVLKDKDEWTSASDREALVALMKERLSVIAGASFEFTQPIQLRFNELITGAKTDIVVQIFGEDPGELARLGRRAEELIVDIPGAGDVRLDQTEGLPQLVVSYDRARLARYGLDIAAANQVIRAAYAGEIAGQVLENERKFDLVVRLDSLSRKELDLNRLYLRTPGGSSIPLSEVASVEYTEGPLQVNRENASRVINVGVNVRGRDVASLVSEIEATLDQSLNPPPGYLVRYGGAFENLRRAQARLSIAVPTALALIFVLLYFTFGRLQYALLIFTAIPLAAVGGVLALWLRDMPFSISAGIGFITLFGVAVLNGIVLISTFNQLREEHPDLAIDEVILRGSLARLRPVLMTAMVAALGFLPMALSTSNGAEVQKPLATVVIGGLITATLLTLVVLPVLYRLVQNSRRPGSKKLALLIGWLFVAGSGAYAQSSPEPLELETAIEVATQNDPALQAAELAVERATWERRRARRWEPLDVSLGLGQYNTYLLDYQLSVDQNLPVAGGFTARTERATADLRLAESRRDRYRRELTGRVSMAYQEWRYAAAQLQLWQRTDSLYRDFLRKAELNFTTGQTDRLVLTLAQNERLLVERQLRQTRLEESQREIALRRLLRTEADYAPLDSSYQATTTPGPSADRAVYLQPARAEVDQRQAAIAVAELERKVRFGIGYFQQSIRPDYNFHGLTARVQIPLDTRPLRAQLEQLRLDRQIAELAYTALERNLGYRDSTALTAFTAAESQLLEYGPQLAEQIRLLRTLAETRLRNGEIDYFDYLQSQERARRAELERLKLIHELNLARLRLTFPLLPINDFSPAE